MFPRITTARLQKQHPFERSQKIFKFEELEKKIPIWKILGEKTASGVRRMVLPSILIFRKNTIHKDMFS